MTAESGPLEILLGIGQNGPRLADIPIAVSISGFRAYGGFMVNLIGVAIQRYSPRTEHDLVAQLLMWVVLGLVAGFIASKLINRRGEGIVLDILLGIVGAFIGGWLFRVFGSTGVTGLNLWSLMVAVVGAVVFLIVYHGIRRVV
jgi:uncharacterized membrane protein YeaQ/YmgE (transglycosylase-associated protein family)